MCSPDTQKFVFGERFCPESHEEDPTISVEAA